MRRAVVVTVLVSLLGITAGTVATTAHASYTSDTAVIADSANDAKLTSELLRWPSTSSGLPGLGISESTGMAAAEEAAGIGVPATSAAIPVAIAGVSSFLVTRELLHLTGGDEYIYRKFSGSGHSASQPDHLTWVYMGTGGTYAHFSGNECAGAVFSSCVTIQDPDGLYLKGTTDGLTQWGTRTPAPNAAAYGDASGATKHAWNGGGGGYFQYAFEASSYAAALELAQAAGEIQTQPSTAAEYASPPAGGAAIDLGTRGSTLTGPQLAAARAKLADGSTASRAASVQIAASMTPLTVLQPLPNETYTDYETRLQASGYLGTITDVAESTALSGYGPNAVTRVQFSDTTGATRILDPLAWPGTAPQMNANAALTVRHNPSTATPVPTDGTSSSSGSDPALSGTDSGCSCPPFDFTPLTGLSLGSKFPFGVFGYMSTVLGWFDVTPVAPGFDINVHAGGTSAHPIAGPGHYSGTLDAFSPYMSIVRDLITVALWVGAIWFVGTRLLGFNAGGDLTEAADDGMVL
jgi:hypothetical protein